MKKQSRRITVTIEDGVTPSNALYKLARWYESHEQNPEAAPLKGVVCFSDHIALIRRDYRVGECFVVVRENR